MIVYHPFRVRYPEHASKFELSRLRMGNLRMAPENAHKFPESKPQTRLPQTITRTVANRYAPTLTQTLQTVKRHDQSTEKDSVYSLIDVLYTQISTEDQIEDTREHAYSKNFRRHCGTHFQWNCDFTDCHPYFLSTPLITIPQRLLPSSLKRPSQKPHIAFHVVGASFQKISIFLLPCAPMWAQWSAP